MRVTDLYKNKHKPVISIEFFPPRSEKASATFESTVDILKAQDPDYMSVTFGAGGSTKAGSYQTVKTIIDKNMPTVAYVTGLGIKKSEITEVLDSYKQIGVETIFVIRGDQPKTEQSGSLPGDFSYASDLIELIKSEYDFTLGCAGYPEGHIEAESLDKDIEYLKLKVDNGAEYIVTQYFYDNRFYFDYVEKCRKTGIDIPIIPGIMPVYTVKMMEMLSNICGSTITEDLKNMLLNVDPEDKEAVLNIGIDFATEQCRGLLKEGVPGLHFYTMGRSKSTGAILDRLKDENLL
jgi:methylenetetrahydrofolate reductase (NADPH)